MLEARLKEMGKSQEWLGEQCGVSRVAARKWLKGRVPAERVLKVSEITGIPPEDLRPDVFTRDLRA